MSRFLLRSLLVLGFLPCLHGAPSTPAPISFNRDIRPIMSDTCFHCHGFDATTREAGMRLDLPEEALKPTKNGLLPIVPGKPEESEIILRIMDEGDPMPPETMHKALTPEQKELFRRWVVEGAVYEPHWAYTPLVKPAVPGVSDVTHPIDAFIRTRLGEKGFSPSAEASDPRGSGFNSFSQTARGRLGEGGLMLAGRKPPLIARILRCVGITLPSS